MIVGNSRRLWRAASPRRGSAADGQKTSPDDRQTGSARYITDTYSMSLTY